VDGAGSGRGRGPGTAVEDQSGVTLSIGSSVFLDEAIESVVVSNSEDEKGEDFKRANLPLRANAA
jgi:hypothetical protein